MSWIWNVTFVLAAVLAGGLSLGIAVYAVGSFALMARHTEPRPFGVALREFVREVAMTSLMQPLLPLFYVLGHRMDRVVLARATAGLEPAPRASHAPHAPCVPIVLVHGYMQNRVGFVGLARELARRGLGPLYGFNYPWFSSIETNAVRLERFIDGVLEETGAASVDLVCHSMGGLVAMEMMRREARHDGLKVRRVVTIATPHAGVAWQGPIVGVGATNLRRGSKLLEAHAGVKLAVPCLSVYSSHDNVVHPKETSQLTRRGGRDVELGHLAHFSILFAPETAEHVVAFLGQSDGPKRLDPRAAHDVDADEGAALAHAAESAPTAHAG